MLFYTPKQALRENRIAEIEEDRIARLNLIASISAFLKKYPNGGVFEVNQYRRDLFLDLVPDLIKAGWYLRLKTRNNTRHTEYYFISPTPILPKKWYQFWKD